MKVNKLEVRNLAMLIISDTEISLSTAHVLESQVG